MPKQSNQKLKILYLAKIFTENTDENHPMTMSEIIAELASYGISAERKSLYDDFENLNLFGLDICRTDGRTAKTVFLQEFILYEPMHRYGAKKDKPKETQGFFDADAEGKIIRDARSRHIDDDPDHGEPYLTFLIEFIHS